MPVPTVSPALPAEGNSTPAATAPHTRNPALGDGHAADAARHRPAAAHAVCSASASRRAVRALRGFARDVAERWQVPDEAAHALCLVVCELVTNSVLHSNSPDVEPAMHLRESTVAVQVKDSGTWTPHEQPADIRHEDAEDGRGLHIVRAYSSRCLIASTRQGTAVRAEIDLPAPLPLPRTADTL